MIGGFIGVRTQDENLALFEAAGVTVAPVCAIEDLLVHPYPVGREAIVAADDPDPRQPADAQRRAAPVAHARHVPPAGAEARRA